MSMFRKEMFVRAVRIIEIKWNHKIVEKSVNLRVNLFVYLALVFGSQTHALRRGDITQDPRHKYSHTLSIFTTTTINTIHYYYNSNTQNIAAFD